MNENKIIFLNLRLVYYELNYSRILLICILRLKNRNEHKLEITPDYWIFKICLVLQPKLYYQQFIRVKFNQIFKKLDMQGNEQQQNKVYAQSIAFEKKWFGIKHLSYTIRGKKVENYESAFRPTKGSSPIDGVEVIPIIKKLDKTLEMVMIANFRPPIGKFCLEFPAGMVENSNFEENALRELTEETGYQAERILKIPEVMINCDPWKSCESGFMYIGIINEENPSHKIKQDLEESQNIRVFTFKIDDDLPVKINQFTEKNNYAIHTKLWALIIGLSYYRFFMK